MLKKSNPPHARPTQSMPTFATNVFPDSIFCAVKKKSKM